MHVEMKTTQLSIDVWAFDSYTEMSGLEDNELDTNLGFNMRSCLKKIMAGWLDG